jgi:hypothetical protein
MIQVEESLTNTTMEKPPPFLAFVAKQKRLEFPVSSGETVFTTGRAWSRGYGEPSFSGESFVTTGSAQVTVTVTAGQAWLPHTHHAWDYTTSLSSGATFMTTENVGVAVSTDTRLGRLSIPHGNAVTSNVKNGHPIVHELYEMYEEKDDDEDEIAINKESILHTIIFAKNMFEVVNINPVIDVYPNGQISLTWRRPRGIINIAFREDGIATYAAYIEQTKENPKGRFRVFPSFIPANILYFIEQIEKA